MVKQFMRKVIYFLPTFVQKMLLLKYYQPPLHTNRSIFIKIAETESELDQALMLLYQEYFQDGLTDNNPNRIRVIKQMFLPTTAIVVAKLGDEVVGTFTLIQDSSIGLPLESYWDIHEIRQNGKPVEVSSLAVSSKFRKQQGRLTFQMFKYAYYLAHDHLKADSFVIAIHPKAEIFYKIFFGFTRISNKIVEYDFVKNAAAVALQMNLKGNHSIQHIRDLCHRKGNSKTPHPFYNYILRKNDECSEYPKSSNYLRGRALLSPRLYKKYFVELTNIHETLTENEKKSLINAYKSEEYLNLEEFRLAGFNALGTDKRYPVSLNSFLKSGKISFLSEVLNISTTGLCVRCESHLPNQSTFEIGVFVRGKTIFTEVDLVWKNGNYSGLRFSKQTPIQILQLLSDMDKEYFSSIS